ncbi:MAG: acetamidase/formamidase family protein [Chloroflexi bacterium]|nr:acetamidase/formamidase family protein [Chloroflexota bacterium]
MQRLTRNQIVYSLDKQYPPAIEIDPGETLLLETYDARTGTIHSSADLLDHPHPVGANPATGPIYVRGAQPGDSLAVEILQIDLADEGFLAVKAHIGLLAKQAQRFETRMIPIRDNQVIFSDRIRFPVRPMVGVIGTAPAGDGVPTGDAGAHGGNMDNRYIRPGTTIYLPVQVPGALLGIGDVHASMGDGEITMVGLEICAEVTVRVNLLKGTPCRRPWLETADDWVTTGDDNDPAHACRIAAEEMIDLLQNKLDLSFEEAYMLMSARGDVQICQMCEPGTVATTARAVFPRL